MSRIGGQTVFTSIYYTPRKKLTAGTRTKNIPPLEKEKNSFCEFEPLVFTGGGGGGSSITSVKPPSAAYCQTDRLDFDWHLCSVQLSSVSEVKICQFRGCLDLLGHDGGKK